MDVRLKLRFQPDVRPPHLVHPGARVLEYVVPTSRVRLTSCLLER